MTRGLYADTRIGPRTTICQRAIILPGLKIGADCLVLAGAVVTKDMPSGTFAVGNPATVRDRGLGGDRTKAD